MPKQVGDKDGKVCCDRLLSAHSANIIILLVVFISHKILFGEAVLRRVACCATPFLSPSLTPPPLSMS